MVAGTHNGLNNEQIIAMLLQSLLVAHEHLINCGTSPSSVNMQVEYALLTAGVDAQTLIAHGMPTQPTNVLPMAHHRPTYKLPR